jgi:hypothetical protein
MGVVAADLSEAWHHPLLHHSADAGHVRLHHLVRGERNVQSLLAGKFRGAVPVEDDVALQRLDVSWMRWSGWSLM